MSRFGSVTVGRRKREGAGLRLREERAGRGERRFGQKRSEEMVSLLVDRGRRTPSRVVVVVVVVPSTLRLASFFLVPSEQKETLAVQRIHRMLFRLPFQEAPYNRGEFRIEIRELSGNFVSMLLCSNRNLCLVSRTIFIYAFIYVLAIAGSRFFSCFLNFFPPISIVKID